ncbi:hypothetical protein [Chondrinema litorale]|uniref:hypothetical protein n=1 Tax=Chondrinema litorale TaxID=2994555 RepID=UPI0025437FF7|nr:hypothetical protein [Chondrinema litorale]UZR98225.1 hypothetical protein OQ292_29950 [Chondrinema litorale]
MKLKKSLLLLSLPIVILFACDNTLVSEECSCLPESDLEITSGTSYGYCVGYCYQELILNSNLETYYEKKSIYDGDTYPKVAFTNSLTQAKYDSIYNSIDFSVFNNLPDTLSDCLDCTDGGAEWIEIKQNGQSKKVVFDAYADIEGLEDLVDILQRLRNEYSTMK